MGDDPALLTSSDLERCLEHVQATAAGPREGVFGPASALWHVDREAVLFVGAGRALLMQLAHPWVATAISAHSTALDDPIGRFHRTFEIVFKLVFGSSDQALATARRLHRLHAAVRGSMPERLGPYAEGAPYFANEVSALRWVHATLVDTALVTYELVRPPLEPEMRERYYGESRRLGALFGIPPDAQPLDASAFANYMGSMLSSEALAVGADARRIGSRGSQRRWARLGTRLVPRPDCRVNSRTPAIRLRATFRRARAAPGNTGDEFDPASIPGAADTPSIRRALPGGSGSGLRPTPARFRDPNT